MQELLLQADRVRRDDHAPRLGFFAAEGRQLLIVVFAFVFRRRRLGGDVRNGWHEVGEALADAGSRFHHQMVAIGQAAIDRLGHRKLLRSMLVAFESGRDTAARGREWKQRRSQDHQRSEVGRQKSEDS